MTATETMTNPNTKTDAFEALKARYPKVREPIVMALHILTQAPNISLDDAKAQAAARGIRITAASVSAAQRLLSRQDAGDAPKAAPRPQAKAVPTAPTAARTRRPRAAKEIDAQALIKQVVDRIQDAGSAETQRLRDGIQKAIGALQAVLSS